MTILQQVEIVVIFMPYFRSIATHTVWLLHIYTEEIQSVHDDIIAKKMHRGFERRQYFININDMHHTFYNFRNCVYQDSSLLVFGGSVLKIYPLQNLLIYDITTYLIFTCLSHAIAGCGLPKFEPTVLTGRPLGRQLRQW